jgi:predicted transcriptional regulator
MRPYDAAKLATTYHDVMTMVSNRSAGSIAPGKSPSKVLKEYLFACTITETKLHNDSWLKVANEVVSELEAKRAQAVKIMLGKG